MMYIKIFLSFVQIGLFSIGGGYAALPLIEQILVNQNHWITMNQFTDLITIASMTPGPIAINASTFVGTKLGGIPGAVVATAGCVTPSCIIVITLAHFYYKYKNLESVKKILETLRPVVVALIGTAGAAIITVAFWGTKRIGALKDINIIAIWIFLFCYIILKKFKKSPITVIILSGIIGIFVYGGII
ncbi:MAG: chromate transporter [Fusobacterium sp. JB019]|nr:chromate transporter [Fusobacterium sp. JB020]MDP0506345.1 chromate transporter [Fusobacterium sp. JB019]